MRLVPALIAASAALAASAAQAASLEIKEAVVRVVIIPEARSDVRVEVIATHPRLPLAVRTEGGRTVIDGDLDRRIRGCRGGGERASVQVAGLGAVAWRDMPQVLVRTPRNVDVSAGGAVFGSVGRAASVSLDNAGCGDWTLANVTGPLKLNLAGSGDVRTGSAGRANLRVAGSGDIATGPLSGGLEASVAGSGGIAAASVRGPLDVRVAGSGDVEVGDGRAVPMTVSVMGSGDVAFGGVADTLKARIAGSGDVRVREVRGAVTKTVMGSGSVEVGGDRAPGR